MKKLSLLFVFALLLSSGSVFAQSVFYAERLSQGVGFGSARGTAMGGAMTAVGGDMSVLGLNPAGLGIYRSGDLQFTGNFQTANTNAGFLNENAEDLNFNFAVPSAGFVIAGESDGTFSSWSFGLGMRQRQNYNRHSQVTGFNQRNSFTTMLADILDGTSNDAASRDLLSSPTFPDNQGNAVLGYNTFTYLQSSIDGYEWYEGVVNNDYDNESIAIDGQYLGAFDDGLIEQRVNLEESGSLNDFTMALSGSIAERYHLGLGLNIGQVNYERELLIVETDIDNRYDNAPSEDPSVPNTDISGTFEVSQRDYLRTRGGALGLTLGFLAQPADFVRIGASIRTPQIMWLNDTYYTDLAITDDNNASAVGESAEATFKYRYISPFRANAGVAFIINKMLILSGDVEFVDYTGARFDADDSNFNAVNQNVDDFMQPAVNVRAGAEFRLAQFYFRGGFGYYQSPWKAQYEAYDVYSDFGAGGQSLNTDRLMYSGGVGVRGKVVYFDLTYSLMQDATINQLYNDPASDVISPTLTTERSLSNIVFTLGFRFGQ